MRILLFLFSTVDAARNCNNSISQTRTQPTPNPNPNWTDRTQPEPEIFWSTRPEPDRVRVGFGFGTRTHTSSSHYLKNQKIKKNKRKFRYWTRLEVSNSYPWQKWFTLYFSRWRFICHRIYSLYPKTFYQTTSVFNDIFAILDLNGIV